MIFSCKKKVDKMGEIYRLTYPRFKKMRRSQLSGRDAMHLEHMCLDRLSTTTCSCGVHEDHFPSVIQYNYDNRQLAVKNVGGNIFDHHTSLTKIPLFSLQIKCICDSLKRCGIQHLDLNKTNICVSDNGTIGLIDFELCVVDQQPLTDELSELYQQHKSDNVILEFKKLFIH